MASKSINAILNLKDNFSKVLKNTSQNTKNFQKQMKAVQLQGQEMRKSITNAFSGISAAAGLAGAAGLGAFLTSSVKTFAGFEQSMSNVEALLGKNATPEILQKLGALAEEMGSKTSKTAKESADALGYMALAGWDATQMMAGLEPILRLSEAGGMDLGRASDLVTDSMSAMGIVMDETGADLMSYLNKMAKAQSSSNTTADQMMEAYVTVGGMFKNFKTPVEESAALLGVLANRGIKGSEAGNSLNSVLINLMGTTSTTSDALEALGVSAYDSKGNFRGVETTLKDIGKAMKTMTAEQKDMLSAKLGGKTQIAALNALLSGLGEEYDELKEKIIDSDGALLATAKTMQNNLLGGLVELKSAFEGVQIQIGKRFAPTLRKVMAWITSSIPHWGNNILFFLDGIYYNFQKCLPVVTGLAAAFGSFMIISTVISMFKALQTTIVKFNLLFFLTNPINLACIAIGALVAGITYLAKTNEDFRNKMISAWTYIQNTWNNALQGFWKWLEVVREEYGSLANFIMSKKTLIATIGGIIASLLTFKLLSPITGIVNLLGASFGQSLLSMISFKGAASGIGKILLMCLHPIKSLSGGFALLSLGIRNVKNSFLLFKTFAPSIISSFIANFGSGAFAFRNVISIFKTGLIGLKTTLMGMFSPFTLVVAAIGLLVAGFIYCWNTNETFRNKLIEAWLQIQPIITGVVTTVLGSIMGLATFLYNFYIEHQTQIKTCLDSVLTIVGGAIAIVVDTISGIINIISGVFQVINGLIHGDWNQMWEGCKNIVKGAIDMIKAWWQDLKKFFATPIKAMINVFKKDSGTDSTGQVEKVDANATGTNYFRGGYTWVGEHGPELMKLPRGTQIKSNSKSVEMTKRNQAPVINVTIQGNVIGNENFINQIGSAIYNKVSLALVNS